MSILQRVQDDDPNRCQAVHAALQCPYRATGNRIVVDGKHEWEGPRYCQRHGGTTQQKQESQANLRLYMSALWRDKIGAQADHPKYKSLREEMGILRMTLERRLDACKSDNELMMYSGSVVEMVREIGKLAKVAHSIEKDMGHLLDKTQAELWVQELLTLISVYVKDPLDLQQLSEDMVASLEIRTRAIC